MRRALSISTKKCIDSDNGFTINAYIHNLYKTYTPDKTPAQSPIRKEMLLYLDKFVAYYLTKGYSPNGAHDYRNELRRFIAYLETYTDVSSIKDITKNMLAEYQIYVHHAKTKDNRPYSLKSKQFKLLTVRKLFRFLAKYDYLEKDPSVIIELPRLERGLPTAIMTDRELELFLNAPDLSTARGLRDRTIMEVLYSTGMRNDELCYLEISDVNFEDGLVKIKHAKGGIGFQRVVPIGRIACDFVKRYLCEARSRLLNGSADTPYLFLNNLGGKLSKITLAKYMRDYRLKTNIRNKITAHSFRVTCATGMLRNHADVRYIQEQLGHRSLISTQVYTRVFPKDLKKVHSTTHPREKTYKKTS